MNVQQISLLFWVPVYENVLKRTESLVSSKVPFCNQYAFMKLAFSADQSAEVSRQGLLRLPRGLLLVSFGFHRLPSFLIVLVILIARLLERCLVRELAVLGIIPTT